MKTILMSIREGPFNALVDGSKLHEFRRKYFLEEPCQVVFYVSSPIKAICGVGIFDKPLVDNIDKLSEIINSHNYSSEESLRSYMEGLDVGYALPMLKVKKINNPITLNELRENIDGFRPPQSYCGFSFDKFKSLINRLELYETQDESIQRTFF